MNYGSLKLGSPRRSFPVDVCGNRAWTPRSRFPEPCAHLQARESGLFGFLSSKALGRMPLRLALSPD